MPADVYDTPAQAGGTCDPMCNILDRDGRTVARPVAGCLMSVGLDMLADAAT